jgi:hypothetical protein
MKRYLIAIREEKIPETNGKKYLFPRVHSPNEEIIFQVILDETQIDIKKVMKTIVEGKE